MRLGTFILEIVGNILMIIGNLDMTCVRWKGTVFEMAAANIVCYDNMDQMTGYNVVRLVQLELRGTTTISSLLARRS